MSFRADIGKLLQRAVRLRATARELKTLKQRATGTLRRRIPVEARRDIQGEYALNAGRINAGLRTFHIDGGVVVQGSGRNIGLIQYGARPTAKGVSYQVFKGQREIEPGAFIARVRSGAQVFVRADKGGRRVARLPIERQFRLSVAQMLRRPDRRDRLNKRVDEILAQELDRLIGALR